MKTLITFLTLSFCILATAIYADEKAKTLKAEEAIKIAIPKIIKKFKDASKNKNDYKVWYKKDIITVGPKLPPNSLGGGPTADIDIKTKKVIRVYFTE
jgi:hypothetical protein